MAEVAMAEGFIRVFCYNDGLSIPGSRTIFQWFFFIIVLAEGKLGFDWSHGTAVNTVKIAEEINIDFSFLFL